MLEVLPGGGCETAGRFCWAQRSEKGFAWSIWDVFKALKCNQRDTGRRRDIRASSLVEVVGRQRWSQLQSWAL